MKPTIKTILAWVFVLELVFGAVSSVEGAVEEKLINSEDILAVFEEGSEKVKVIVNLAEPQAIKSTTDWNSRPSLERLNNEIRGLQDHVLSTLSSNDFQLRHRFENQAGFSGEVTLDGLAKLLNDPRVKSVEPVYELKIQTRQGIPLMNASTYRSIYGGAGMAIAIVDTGIDYNHPELGGGGFPNNKVIGGYDFGCNDPDPAPDKHACYDNDGNCIFAAEDHAHGTCCAGIAAGEPNDANPAWQPSEPNDNPNDYIGGVAPSAKLYALKVIGSDCNMWSDSTIAAWDWCVRHKNDDPDHPIIAISNSLGSPLGFNHPCDCFDKEDFETGDFFKLPWVHLGEAHWTITSNEKYSGTYSARAGRIGHDESSVLGLMLDCESGNIRFQRKVSSELNYDGLAFFIDEDLKGVWSGNVPWGRESYNVTEGEHVFMWIYLKDVSFSSGADTAWIDDIEFPVECPSAYARAADNATKAGITILAASGNDGYCDRISSPACLNNLISVGSVYDANIGQAGFDDIAPDSCVEVAGFCFDWVTAEDMVPCYSNTADILDILAPAHNVGTTDAVGQAGYSSGNYFGDYGGTSASCPYAAGAVACLQSAAKTILNRYLTPSEIRDKLTSTGDNVTDAKANITKPRVNLGRAIDSLRVEPPPPSLSFADDFEDGVIDSFWNVGGGDWTPCPGSDILERNGILTITLPGGQNQDCDRGIKSSSPYVCGDFETSVDFRVPRGALGGMAWLSASSSLADDYSYSVYLHMGLNYNIWYKNKEGSGWESGRTAFRDETTTWHQLKIVYDAETTLITAYVDNIVINSKKVDLTNVRVGMSGKLFANESTATFEFDNFHFIRFMPDLRDGGEENRSFSPQTVVGNKPGQSFEIKCDVRNRGNADSNPFTVEFYASKDQYIVGGSGRATDDYIGQNSVPGIPAGGSVDCMWTGQFPTSIPAGSYYVGWIIDPDNEVNESDEDNNTAYKEDYQLTVSPAVN